MKPRHKRFAFIGLGLLVLGVATVLILNAFQSNLVFLRPVKWRTAKCRKDVVFASAAWSKAESRPRERRPDGPLHRHRYREARPGDL